ncbi:hypothetical protein INR49_005821, partial [Caranx melampygus]
MLALGSSTESPGDAEEEPVQVTGYNQSNANSFYSKTVHLFICHMLSLVGEDQGGAVHGHAHPTPYGAEAMILELLYILAAAGLHHIIQMKHSRLSAVQNDHRAQIWKSEGGKPNMYKK